MAELENILPETEGQESLFQEEGQAEECLAVNEEAEASPAAEDIISPAPADTDEADALRREISELKGQIEARRARDERTLCELEEFGRLYPEISLEQLDEGVWERVRSGLPLSAAYALYAREQELLVARAEEVNAKNAALSAGSAGLSAPRDYFSPEEVRAMSGAEVRKNYASIKRSMNYWQKAAK